MMDPEGPAAHPADPEPSEEGLRQVLLRLTRPGYEPLQEEIEALRLQIQALEELRGDLQELRLAFTEGDEDLLNRIDKIVLLLEEARQRQAGLGRSLDGLEESLGRELRGLHQELSDPQQVSGRVSPVLVPLLHEHARSERAEFAEALAPAIGPAIRHQLREAREDIIESLYPVIGQIIGKAVSEAFRELTRNIDARLRGRFRFRSSLSHFLARLKGVSEAEILLREALPFSIQHIFLVHRQTGLHLEHISVSGGQTQDLDLISGMLTAIRDFVHDSFRDVEGDLEEITLGEHRILLEAGQFAYLAVVLKGIEPPGYNERIHRVIHSINIQHERALSGFIGDMHALPDLKPALAPLIPSETIETRAVPGTQPLSRSQKWAAGAAFIGITLTLALAVFACVFTVRLWPY